VFSCLIMASCTLQLLQMLEGHTDRVWHVSWSPDGATVLELCSRPYDISPVRNQTVLRRCDIGKLQCRQNC
jgi:WD40 repeat protein